MAETRPHREDTGQATDAPRVAVLATLDSKAAEAEHACAALRRHGATPWLVDLAMRPHDVGGADVPGSQAAAAAGSDWAAVAELGRGEAAATMAAGGRAVLEGELAAGRLHGVLGMGGANGTTLACGAMRELPLHFPKVVLSSVASTAAVQWYVDASDIVMVPSVGDFALNRITAGLLDHAAAAAAAMARSWRDRADERAHAASEPPLVAVSSFGGTAGCVEGVERGLREAGHEVVLLHASGPGGRALERLARAGELAGVVDVTTHELADHVVGGVYTAGDERLRGAGAVGLPQVVVPGAVDHANLWVGQVPDRFGDRDFHQYNAHNLLMRVDAEESEAIGAAMAERLAAASGPVLVVVPARGFSEHTARRTHGLDGAPRGPWRRPEVDGRLVAALRAGLAPEAVCELDLHVNDPPFAEACVAAFLALGRGRGPEEAAAEARAAAEGSPSQEREGARG